MGNKSSKKASTPLSTRHADPAPRIKEAPKPRLCMFLATSVIGGPGVGKTKMFERMVDDGKLTYEGTHYTKFIDRGEIQALEVRIEELTVTPDHSSFPNSGRFVFIAVDLSADDETLHTECHRLLRFVYASTQAISMVVFLGTKCDIEQPGAKAVVEKYVTMVEGLYFPVTSLSGDSVEQAIVSCALTASLHDSSDRVPWEKFADTLPEEQRSRAHRRPAPAQRRSSVRIISAGAQEPVRMLD